MVKPGLKDKIKRIFAEKAEALGLHYNGTDVLPARKEVIPGMEEIGGHLFVDFVDKVVKIEVADVDSFSDEELEMALEHEACHCMDYEEKVYGRETFCPSGDGFVRAMALEMDYTNGDYFASKRQIAEFGMERFARFHMRDFEEFVRRNDSHLRQGYEPMQQMALVFAFFKEQLKCDLMDDKSGIMPPVIAQITAPFADCFEMIRKSELGWIRKSSVMYMMTCYAASNLVLPATYHKGRLVFDARQTDMSCMLAEKEVIDGATFTICSKAEDLMNASYRVQDANGL